MIQVTLTFVSIEALRAALLEIPASALVGSGEAAAPEVKTKEVAAAPVEKPKKATAAATPAAPAPTQPTAEVAAETAAPEKTAAESSPTAESAEAEPQPSTAATERVDYPTLQKAVFTLAGKSRDAAAAVAQSFGVKTFKELPEAKWAEALAAVQAKTAELG